MRSWARGLTVGVLIVSCGASPDVPEPTGTSPTPSPIPSPSPSPSPDPSPSPAPTVGDMPTRLPGDLEPNEIPPEMLVPEGAGVTGHWFAFTNDGVAILVAWAEPGLDPFRLPRGLAIWRRGLAAWRADLIERHPASDGISEMSASTTDMTGDGSDDALLFVGLGGSGNCGRWALVDLLTLRKTFVRRLCDGRVDPGPIGSPGLVILGSVYREGDAHCCPSAMRRTTLTWDGTRWRVTDRQTTAT